jgi:hypothetical protein
LESATFEGGVSLFFEALYVLDALTQAMGRLVSRIEAKRRGHVL